MRLLIIVLFQNAHTFCQVFELNNEPQQLSLRLDETIEACENVPCFNVFVKVDDAAYFYNEEGSPLAASPPSKFATTTVMVKRKCKKPETATWKEAAPTSF